MSTPPHRRSGSAPNQRGGGMQTLKREEKWSEGTKVTYKIQRRPPGRRHLSRSQFGSRRAKYGVSTCSTEGKPRCGEQQNMPTLRRAGLWNSEWTENASKQTQSRRQRKRWDTNRSPRTTTTSTTGQPHWKAHIRRSPSKQLGEPYIFNKPKKLWAQACCLLAPYNYSGGGINSGLL